MKIQKERNDSYSDIISRLKRKLHLLKKTTFIVHDGVQDDVINAYCEKNNLFLPDEMKMWLRICNGISSGNKKNFPICFDEIYGIFEKKLRFGTPDLALAVNGFPYWKSSGYIPICYDGCGNVYLLIPQIINNNVRDSYDEFQRRDSVKADFPIDKSAVLTENSSVSGLKYPVAYFEASYFRDDIYDTPTCIMASNLLIFLDRLLLDELLIKRLPECGGGIKMLWSKEITIKHDPSILQFELKKPWES
jgi:hypothetical protein